MKKKKKSESKVILISIDGLWPGLYSSGQLPDQFVGQPVDQDLARLARAGTQAQAAEAVFPTLTYTNHASIATGAPSDRHGIFANTRFDPSRVEAWRGFESQDWILESKYIRTQTIWDAATEAGVPTGLIRWPSTVGAKARWCLPDIFPILSQESVWSLIKRTSTPDLISKLTRDPDFEPPGDDHRQLDQLTKKAALALLRAEESPQLLLVHFTSLDHEAHEKGRNSPMVPVIAREIYQHVQAILSAVDLSRTSVFVCGDHGFAEFDHRVNINALLYERGWFEVEDGKVTDWQAIAHTNCSVAPVYAKDPTRAEEIMADLRSQEGEFYRVLDREELKKLRAFPDAICAVETTLRASLGQKVSGALIEKMPAPRGEHGWSALLPEMLTGFFAIGAGIKKTHRIDRIKLIDLAPTIATILGFSLPHAEGRVLNEIFESANPTVETSL
jgi:predicted AlkP superfamily pyrophosphatase or phosphodiesterase